jgi:tetratricopeptide (TPR) repeat protein
VTETGAARIPPTVEDVLMARIDRLPAPVKSVLQTSAVIGRLFSRSLLERVVDDDPALDAALDTLVGLGLLHRGGSGDVYSCEQPLVHEVTYGALLKQHRKVLHRRIGESLEALAGQRLLGDVEDLARHFAQAEDWTRAVRYHYEAGRKAAGLAANTQAVEWYQRALELLGRLRPGDEVARQTIEVQLDLCRAMVQLGQLEEVLKRAREAAALARRLGDAQRLGEVYAHIANYHYMKGEPDQAIHHGRLCLGLGDQSATSATRRAARQYLGTSYHALGEYDMAEEILTEQVAELESTEGVERVGPVNLAYAASCGWLAFTLTELGEFGRAHQVAERGLRRAADAGHPYARAIATSFAGLVWQVQGDVDRARPLFETSFGLCTEHRLEVWRPLAMALLGHACALGGESQRGLDLLWEAAGLNERLGVLAYRALWTTYLAEALLLTGQTTAALAQAEQALELAVAHNERGNATRALQLLGRGFVQQGPAGFHRAAEHLRQALEQAERLRMRPLVAACYDALAALARKRGEDAAAARFATTARSVAAELGMRLGWERRAS